MCSKGRPDARLTFICQSSKTQGLIRSKGREKNTPNCANLTATIKVLDVLEVFDLTTSEPVLFLFGKHKGVRGGCWCTFHRCTSGQFDRMTRDERKKFHKELAQQGRGYGLLVYDAGTPVAWCQFGPADGFPRYDRGAPMGSWHWKRTKCRSGASHVYLLTNTDVVRA